MWRYTFSPRLVPAADKKPRMVPKNSGSSSRNASWPLFESISTKETFERDLVDRAALHAELRRMAGEVASYLRRDGLSARTVTAKLRYADFSLRSRSTTLQTPIDEPERIGELACELLDRALDQRPGALRLVGVGVSGLGTESQLALV